MLILPKGLKVGKKSVLIPLSICKGLIYSCEPAGDPLSYYPSILANAQQAGDSPPQRVFFQPHGLISSWQHPSEWMVEVKCPFQSLIHRAKHLLLPTLALLAGHAPQTPTLSRKSFTFFLLLALHSSKISRLVNC